jgi:hypothetical protein
MAGVQNSWVPSCVGDLSFVGWLLIMKLALCYASGTYNFELAARFLGNLWTPE